MTVAVAIGYAMRNKPKRAVRAPINMLQAERLLMSPAMLSVGIKSSFPHKERKKIFQPCVTSTSICY